MQSAANCELDQVVGEYEKLKLSFIINSKFQKGGIFIWPTFAQIITLAHSINRNAEHFVRARSFALFTVSMLRLHCIFCILSLCHGHERYIVGLIHIT